MRRTSSVFALAALAMTSSSCAPSTESLLADNSPREKITLTSSAFADGAKIPVVYTCDGKDVSPPLAWSRVPKSAQSLVLICEDPDAPRGTWTHWVLFGIRATVSALEEGIPTTERANIGKDGDDADQGKNDFGNSGYGGPCPPSGTHHYRFTIFALDSKPQLPATTTRVDLLRAIKGHIVAEGRLTGLYSR